MFVGFAWGCSIPFTVKQVTALFPLVLRHYLVWNRCTNKLSVQSEQDKPSKRGPGSKNIARHRNISTNVRVYVHVSAEKQKTPTVKTNTAVLHHRGKSIATSCICRPPPKKCRQNRKTAYRQNNYCRVALSPKKYRCVCNYRSPPKFLPPKTPIPPTAKKYRRIAISPCLSPPKEPIPTLALEILAHNSGSMLWPCYGLFFPS